MNPAIMRIAKGVVGAVVLIVLLVTVSRWWGEYRDHSTTAKPAAQAEKTPSQGEGKAETPKADAQKAEPAEQKPETAVKTKIVVVRTDGLNFRKQPQQDSTVIRGLDKGEKLTYLKEDGGWFQVQDADGVKGWISSKPQYAELQ